MGTDRCRFFQHPTYKVNGKLKQINDINECLYRLGKEETRKCIDAAINAPNPKVIDFSDIKSVDWSQVDGVSFGLKELDKQLFKASKSLKKEKFYTFFNYMPNLYLKLKGLN